MNEMSDLYVKCPRCRGNRCVYAITRPGNEFRSSVSEEFSCPLCSGTGEAAVAYAAEWIAEQQEDEDE